MDRASIQIQDITGRWFTVETVSNTDQNIQLALTRKHEMFKKKVRAVDKNGRLLDIKV